jgi:hypothetical protein
MNPEQEEVGFPTGIKGRVNVNDTHVTFLVGQTWDKHPFSSYFDILVGTPNSRERERERQTETETKTETETEAGRGNNPPHPITRSMMIYVGVWLFRFPNSNNSMVWMG